VNYIQALEEVDFPCRGNSESLLFKGNQLRAETGYSLLVAGGRVAREGSTLLVLPK
jgi:hypothetical protein